MNILNIIIGAIVAYIVYLVLVLLGLPAPLPLVVGLLVFVLGVGGSQWGGWRV